MPLALDLSELGRVIGRLDEAIGRCQREPNDDLLRDGLIQRFEVTYELCHRMLRRFIRETSASPEAVDQMAFQDLIQTANQQGLLRSDWPVWHRYRDLRARTSHTYLAAAAEAVAAAIPDFMAEAEHLRNELRRRLA
ncbi:MAG: HI0074 family nucleotidyltransferase substrate-binding subunit [Rhodopila sp.]